MSEVESKQQNKVKEVLSTSANLTSAEEHVPSCSKTKKESIKDNSPCFIAIDCPICLQTCVHPAQLPCGHIFCFLCVKGVAYKNRRCAMCRGEIPAEFLEHPQLVNGILEISKTKTTEDGFQWFYEGRNGWWQYDERTSQDIEEAYKKGENFCTILVAGYVYLIDFEGMLQQRQNEPTRKRNVKRDLASIPKKGVAGLRIEENFLTTDLNLTLEDNISGQINFKSMRPPILALQNKGSEMPAGTNDCLTTTDSLNFVDSIASDVHYLTYIDVDQISRINRLDPIMSGSSYIDQENRGSLCTTEDHLNVAESVTSESGPSASNQLQETLNNFHSWSLRELIETGSNNDEESNEEIIL